MIGAGRFGLAFAAGDAARLLNRRLQNPNTKSCATLGLRRAREGSMSNQAMHERLLDLIQAEGVETLFGIPDPSFFAMFIEAERRGMEIVSPHHEQAAA